MTFLTPTRERFLQAIAKEIAADQIAEIHFFHPMKQGGVESGVAVVAADAPSAEKPAAGAAEIDVAEERDVEPSTDESTPAVRSASRYTVYTARYRHVLKGPDRGKWEASVVAEADAPLVTVDAVVRGVQRRSGDVDPPDRLTGDEVRGLVPPAAAVTPSPDRL